MQIQRHPYFILSPVYLLFLILAFTSNTVFAQIKLGDNRTIIQPGSLIELESTNRGLLNIRLNTSQMLSIPVTASSKGMMIYNTDSSCLCLYDGSNWRSLCKSQSSRQLKAIYTATAGDSAFLCPEIVLDENHVQIFRNGVQVNFTATIGTKNVKLESEAHCNSNDEIKIVQLVNP
ncbi:MAG: hypothetical protein V4561_13610 [Bacteroidota bacterium]